MRPRQFSCGLLALHKAQVPEWCTGIPVLVCWATVAVFQMAAIGFALLCVSVDACVFLSGCHP